MVMDKDIEYWLEIAEYDLDTARALLGSGRYAYVLFMCQQAVEKILKGLVVKNTHKLPPRLHNLLRLSELTGLDLEQGKKELLEKLSYYYLESRYPEEQKKITAEVDRKVAGDYLLETEEIFTWLKSRLK
ncbi:MAG: HEPN domain-containing protein [Candidatus Margulisbacteria bacterium]|nr:HEPN domain-containing protein [Candidatus Margulisiibacteriota bacterium]